MGVQIDTQSWLLSGCDRTGGAWWAQLSQRLQDQPTPSAEGSRSSFSGKRRRRAAAGRPARSAARRGCRAGPVPARIPTPVPASAMRKAARSGAAADGVRSACGQRRRGSAADQTRRDVLRQPLVQPVERREPAVERAGVDRCPRRSPRAAPARSWQPHRRRARSRARVSPARAGVSDVLTRQVGDDVLASGVEGDSHDQAGHAISLRVDQADADV